MALILERPRTDKEICQILNLSPWQLQKVQEYIETGAISLEVCDCAGGDIGCEQCRPYEGDLEVLLDGTAPRR